MTTLSDELRAAREKKNIPLEQIADETHITLRHLENLEQGRYSQLPGGMYNRAFLRAYCGCVGLDPARALQKYAAETTSISEKSVKKGKNLPPLSIRGPINPVIIWTLMLVISITSLFYSRRWIARFFSPYFSRPAGVQAPQRGTSSNFQDGSIRQPSHFRVS